MDAPFASLFASLAWVSVAVYAVSHAADIAHRWLDLHTPSTDPIEVPIVLPADVEALAQQESAVWAQDDVRKAARERYDALRDSALSEQDRWNLVRKALGIGTF